MTPPTQEEYETLFKEMNAGSASARNELIERHIRLVASIALKFRMTNIPMEDLMAEGIQGLIVALDKFDHTRESSQYLRSLVDQAENPTTGNGPIQ